MLSALKTKKGAHKPKRKRGCGATVSARHTPQLGPSHVGACRSFGSDLLAHLLATIQQLLLGRSIPGLASRPGDRYTSSTLRDRQLTLTQPLTRIQP